MINVMLQTSDLDRYSALLDTTKIVNQAYAAKTGICYSSYTGIKRGFYPWHAAYNRIPMLKELASDRDMHWAFYIDADAYIFDTAFDVNSYLATHADKAMIIGEGSSSGYGWDVNSGVFFINLQHSLGQEIIATWNDIFDTEVSEADLRKAERPFEISLNDQTMLQRMLRTNRRFFEATVVEKRQFINSRKSSFVRQLVRTDLDTIETRIERARADIETAMQRFASH